jgi:hypothetical protein
MILPITALVAAVLRPPFLIAVEAHLAILGIRTVFLAVIILPPASPTSRL